MSGGKVAEGQSVINNAMTGIGGVINDVMPKTAQVKAHTGETFRDYANRIREIESVRQWGQGRGRAAGGRMWWYRLGPVVRAFLLTTIGMDDWEKYVESEWQTLPDALRSAISFQSRSLQRMLEGCPWR